MDLVALALSSGAIGLSGWSLWSIYYTKHYNYPVSLTVTASKSFGTSDAMLKYFTFTSMSSNFDVWVTHRDGPHLTLTGKRREIEKFYAAWQRATLMGLV